MSASLNDFLASSVSISRGWTQIIICVQIVPTRQSGGWHSICSLAVNVGYRRVKHFYRSSNMSNSKLEHYQTIYVQGNAPFSKRTHPYNNSKTTNRLPAPIAADIMKAVTYKSFTALCHSRQSTMAFRQELTQTNK